MSFPNVAFDLFLRELGEMVRLRDAALGVPELAASEEGRAALQALKDAVTAVGQVAQAGDPAAELAAARAALTRARSLFTPVAHRLARRPSDVRA
jgi:hypothetical protein